MTRKGKAKGRGRGAVTGMESDDQLRSSAPTLPLGLTVSDSENPSKKKGRGRGQRSSGTVASNGVHEPSSPRNLPLQPNSNHAPAEIPCTSMGIENLRITPNSAQNQSTGFEALEKSGFKFCAESHMDATKMARRPGVGVQGRPIALYANYFVMQYKNSNIYHYDVEINSIEQLKKFGNSVKTRGKTAAEATKAGFSNLEQQLSRGVGKAKCREVIAKMVQVKSLEKYNIVYDGNKNIYTSLPLPIKDKQTVVVNLEVFGKMRPYEVIVQPVQKENGSNVISLRPLLDSNARKWDVVPQEILMAFNTVMGHREPHCDQIQVGRSFFFLNQTSKVPLGEGIEIWFGYNQSVHFTERGPAVVLNLAAKAFHKAGPVIDYANDVLRCDITRSPALSGFQINRLVGALKGVRVEVMHLAYPRRYAIQGISQQPASELTFDIDGRKKSVAQYFQEKYKKLRFPHLPCLHMRSNNNKTYIPIENCKVVDGQPKLGKLSGATTAKMIRQTAVPAEERFRHIVRDAQTVMKVSGQQMNNFSLFMDLQPMKLMGRIIDAPALAYCGQNRNVAQPDCRGIWRMDGKQFFQSSKAKSWILISFSDERNECSRATLESFAETLSKAGRKAGLSFGQLQEIKICNRNVATLDALQYAKKSEASFALIVLSKRDANHSYEEVKFFSDFKLGLVTQCMDESVIQRFSDQIASNVCLKINTKLGGVNHVLVKKPEIFARPVMVLGADAVHSPRGSGCPSIAAVVGSLDAYPSRYKLACRVQENPDGNKVSQELILELKEMVVSILKAFNHRTLGKYPEKILFFRDGVSEGQFGTVFEYEVSKIQEACREEIGCIVPITFIVVQKRHQTRFRPQDPKNGVGRMGNIPPGTTVDTDVTHPRFFDYFLCSHEGIQGTSKPAKYTVLHDDNNFQADELQRLSYHLCHMYVRCNRSISIPAPVMYADLAAYRAKKYADWHIQLDTSRSSASSDSSCRLPDHVRNAINDMENYATSMFFV